MSAHTPGPWALSSFIGNLGRHITLESHLSRPIGASVDSQKCRDTYQINIAAVGRHACHLSIEEAEANARLIAAAPDLLAALQECALRLGALVLASGDFSDVNANAIDQAHAAIQKAEGQS